MPLRNRAWGRPKATSIPSAWGEAHAPALERMANAAVTLLPLPAGTPELGADFKPVAVPAVAPLWSGRGKVEALSTQRRVQVLGEQAVTIGAFDVEIPHDVTPPPIGTVVTVEHDGDPSMTGRPLFVADVERGGARFGRHLTCVDDLTLVTTATTEG